MIQIKIQNYMSKFDFLYAIIQLKNITYIVMYNIFDYFIWF
jgi:hypothetical protein